MAQQPEESSRCLPEPKQPTWSSSTYTIKGKDLVNQLVTARMPIPQKDLIVTTDLEMAGQTFHQPVNFHHVYFRGQVNAAGATFDHGFKVSASAFDKPVDLSNVISHGAIDFRDSVFRSTSDPDQATSLDLSKARIEGVLNLRNDLFEGHVDASDMVVTGTLAAQSNFFLDRAPTVDNPSLDLSNTAVGASVVLKCSRIRPPIDFSNLLAQGSLNLRKVVLANDPRGESGDWRWGCDYGPLAYSPYYEVASLFPNRCRSSSFEGLHVEGSAEFNDAVLQGCLVLDRASFGGVGLGVVPTAISPGVCKEKKSRQPTDNSPPLSVDGLSFSKILGGRAVIENMAQLFREHVPNGQVQAAFGLLEAAAVAQDDRESADNVHIQAEWLRTWDADRKHRWLDQFSMRVSGLFIGFGRRPLQALAIWAVFMLVGALAFALLQRLKQMPAHPNPFFYSVTSFFPSEWARLSRWGPDYRTPARVVMAMYMALAFLLFAMFVFAVSWTPWAALLSLVGAFALYLDRVSHRFPGRAR